MSVLTARADVAYKLAIRESEGDFRDWLAVHSAAVDSDGNQVICVFAPDEPAERMLNEVIAYPHPVIIASEVDGHLVAAQLGEGISQAPSGQRVVRVADQTVADLMRAFQEAAAASSTGSLAGVVLEYALVGARRLVLT